MRFALDGSTRRALLLIMVLALVLRLAVTVAFEPVPPSLSDAEYYEAAARSVAGGTGYEVRLTETQFVPGDWPTAFFPPGFSFYLAGFYKLLGAGVDVARIANVAAGVLTIPVVYLIGVRLLGPREGLLGALLAAISPSLALWTPVLLSETLFTLVFGLALFLVVDALRGGGRLVLLEAALAGAVIGLAALVRGQALVLLPVAFAWWWLHTVPRSRVPVAAALAAVAVLLLLTPWTLRNLSIFDEPVLLSTNFGYNLRVGHAEYSNGRFVDPVDLYELVDPGENLELTLNAEGARLAVDYALAHPGRELELSLDKVRWLWSPDTDVVLWLESFGATPIDETVESALQWPARVMHWATLALLVPALLSLGMRHRAVSLAGLLALAWTAVHIVFFGEPRYHLPLLPLLLPFTAAGLLVLKGFLPLSAEPAPARSP
jgi:4-amino-4-deoxy-L-arabinose transferase-like glycosyltransferase